MSEGVNARAKGLSEGVLVFRRWWVGEESGESESRESGSSGSKSMIIFVVVEGDVMGVKCVVEGHGCSKIVALLHETVTLEVCNGETLVLESSSSVSIGVTFIISPALLLALSVRFFIEY